MTLWGRGKERLDRERRGGEKKGISDYYLTEEQLTRIVQDIRTEDKLIKQYADKLWRQVMNGDATYESTVKTFREIYSEGFEACERLHAISENESYQRIGFGE